MTELHKASRVRAAFMPLLDAAPLIVAARLGFAREEGLDLILERETSWASLRDRIAVGQFDVAHMLAPMPIAANLGLTALPVRLVVPMALGFGGNAITVSNALWGDLSATDGDGPASLDAMTAGRRLADVVRRRAAADMPRLVVAVVHPHSAHFYQLAYWLAASGLDPMRDVDIIVVPPPLTAAALEQGQIDAFSAGEPWGCVAVGKAVGNVLATSTSIWRSSPEKVLGLRASWLEEEPSRTHALIRSIHRAGVWCDDPSNEVELIALLSRGDAVDVDAATIASGLARRFEQSDRPDARAIGFLTFARNGASFPWLSHAAWFYTQMVRWGHAAFTADGLATAQATYRPDLYRAALGPSGVDLPAANSKVEGKLTFPTPVGSSGGRLLLGPDTFCDDLIFDPEAVPEYLARLPHFR